MSAVLLQRESELAEIGRQLDAARRGHGSVAAIVGAPGSGKSSLIAAASERAEADGLTVLRARASEMELSFAFGVARQLFEPLLSCRDGGSAASVLGGQAGQAALVGLQSCCRARRRAADRAADRRLPVDRPGVARVARLHGPAARFDRGRRARGDPQRRRSVIRADAARSRRAHHPAFGAGRGGNRAAGAAAAHADRSRVRAGVRRGDRRQSVPAARARQGAGRASRAA